MRDRLNELRRVQEAASFKWDRKWYVFLLHITRGFFSQVVSLHCSDHMDLGGFCHG